MLLSLGLNLCAKFTIKSYPFLLFRPQKELSDGSKNFQYFKQCSVFLAISSKLRSSICWPEKKHTVAGIVDGWRKTKVFVFFFNLRCRYYRRTKTDPVPPGTICTRIAFCGFLFSFHDGVWFPLCGCGVKRFVFFLHFFVPTLKMHIFLCHMWFFQNITELTASFSVIQGV